MDCRDHVTPVTAINGCRRHPAHVADDIAPPTQERQDETFYERRLCEPRAFHRRARDRRRGRRPAWPGADHSAPAAALRLAASPSVADLVRGPGPLLQALLRDEWGHTQRLPDLAIRESCSKQLPLCEIRERSCLGDELRVASHLHDLAAPEHDDAIRIAD